MIGNSPNDRTVHVMTMHLITVTFVNTEKRTKSKQLFLENSVPISYIIALLIIRSVL